MIKALSCHISVNEFSRFQKNQREKKRKQDEEREEDDEKKR